MEITKPAAELEQQLGAYHYHGDRLVLMASVTVDEGRRDANDDGPGFTWQTYDHTCPECGERFQYQLRQKDLAITLPDPTIS